MAAKKLSFAIIGTGVDGLTVAAVSKLSNGDKNASRCFSDF